MRSGRSSGSGSWAGPRSTEDGRRAGGATAGGRYTAERRGRKGFAEVAKEQPKDWWLVREREMGVRGSLLDDPALEVLCVLCETFAPSAFTRLTPPPPPPPLTR